MLTRLPLFLLLLVSLWACNSNSSGNAQKDAEKESTKETVQALPSQASLTQIWSTDSVLLTAESVKYDPERKVIYVANINKDPWKPDEDGFLSRLDLEGNVLEERWISGLGGPKGMAISGDKLYVADIHHLIIVSIGQAKVLEKVSFEGSEKLNDVTIDNSGKIYITDMGASKIYTYDKGKIEEWTPEGTQNPNGIYALDQQIIVGQSGTGNLVAYDLQGKQNEILATGIKTDGIEYTGHPGKWIVSEWAGEVWLVEPEQKKKSLLNTKEQKIQSADIGFIPGEEVILVPTFFSNKVVAYKMNYGPDNGAAAHTGQ